MSLDINTPLKDLVDVQVIPPECLQLCSETPEYWHVLDKIKTETDTLVDCYNFLMGLKVHICLGIHESVGNQYDAESCPFRDTNLACLHGLDWSSEVLSKNLQFDDLWSLKIFGIACFLKQQGYEVPLFINDFFEAAGFLEDVDNQARNMHSGALLGLDISDERKSVSRFQKETAQIFLLQVVQPIRSVFLEFYETNLKTIEASADDQFASV